MSKDDFNANARKLELRQRLLEKARERGDEAKVKAFLDRMDAVTKQEMSPEEEAIMEDARIAQETGESRVIRALNIVAAMEETDTESLTEAFTAMSEGRTSRLVDNAAEEKRQELEADKIGTTVTLEP